MDTGVVTQGEEKPIANWTDRSPPEWEAYVNKEVTVTADEKNKYQGWVATIDPVSASVVLVNLEDKTSVRIVMGHAVQKVEILKEADEATKQKLINMFNLQESSRTYNKQDLDAKKLNLKSWLQKNNIPVSEQGESMRTLCVAGVLTIDPPYGPENCNSTNEIILSRIQGLIQGYMTSQ
ncbi:gem-associated protein 6 [Hyla sarda]|uniref:gem-associated protein 6 n=1 Tax=Hyla sarda TaxID=327740 RepID=UPI0024C38150|nr:gem-associated protein 6 [Hyla sarda]XP_056423426.1 gem-associated protein 6 [Hyla sarda]XP_056423428.1 gem-associated protein 6 [Hyla sarda]XP_056423429.1 gem-associated protein 6 [Hyla sarda]XP_056423430.1 gem-associated protein 6 [Hyla sarda]XP_056423431.1 gem-associated protein 6 [Hyla sarda]